MDKKKIVLCSRLYDEGYRFLEDKVDLIEAYTDNLSENNDIFTRADGILIGNQKLTGDFLNRFPNLKVIAKQGSGYDNIDIAAATEKRIPVVLSAGVNACAVAEHVIMMILSASRRLIRYNNAVRNGNFQIRTSAQEKEIINKTIGLIGLGKIGMYVGKYATALGMKVCVYDPFIKAEKAQNLGFQYHSDLLKMLQISDVVSVHVPLTPSTRNMISDNEIGQMKNGVVIVNCSRGNIINEDALIKGLKSGKVFGAGIDVYGQEPVSEDNPLLKLDNVVLTPHSAALTEESTKTMSLATAKGVWAVLNGEKWDVIANPEVFAM